MDGTLLACIKDEKYCPVVITLEKGDYHFQTDGTYDTILKGGAQCKELFTVEDYQEKRDSLNDLDFTYEIIFPYKPTEEQVRLWIRLFAPTKEEEFLHEIQKKIVEFEEK